MYEIFKAAAVQMNSGPDMDLNLRQAETFIREASAKGAKLIVTPEYTNLLSAGIGSDASIAMAQGDDVTLARLRDLARDLGVWIHAGSLAIRVSDEKVANRSFLLNDKGDIVATYDKIHLFDVDLPNGESHRESDTVVRGDTVPVVETPFGKIGMAICYDLRFPEQFNAMAQAGAEIILAPAAYTVPSGLRTWEPFLRARAAENASFVIAPGQCGYHNNLQCWGHSMIVGPWGTILSRTSSAPSLNSPDYAPGVVIAQIERAELVKARQSYPVFQQKKDSPFKVVSHPVAKPAP